MFTPTKSKSSGVLNDTVLSTPLPQATSTVRRKAMYVSQAFSEKVLHLRESTGVSLKGPSLLSINHSNQLSSCYFFDSSNTHVENYMNYR